MKPIIKKSIFIIFSLCLFFITGCSDVKTYNERNTREWMEQDCASIEKAYPTANLDDLFQKFPEGYVLYQGYNNNGVYQMIDLVCEEDGICMGTIEFGDSTDLGNLKPEMKEDIWLEDGEIVCSEEAKSRMLTNHFLFQELTLNKEILSQFKMIDKEYTYMNGNYDITYEVQSETINRFFDRDSKDVCTLKLKSETKNEYMYYYALEISYGDDIYYAEKVSNAV